MNNKFPTVGLVRLPQIIGPGGPLPVSRSLFLQKVREKEWPQPIRVSSRVTCWRAQDILDLIAAMERGGVENERV